MIKNLLRACSLIACRLTNETPVFEQNAGSALAVKMMPRTLVGAQVNDNDEHMIVVGEGVGLRVFSLSPGMVAITDQVVRVPEEVPSSSLCELCHYMQWICYIMFNYAVEADDT